MLIWEAHKGKIESAAFSADGRYLATATGNTRLVYLWDPSTGKLVRKLDGNWPSGLGLGSVKSVCFAPQAPLLAAGSARSERAWSRVANTCRALSGTYPRIKTPALTTACRHAGSMGAMNCTR